MIYYFGTTEYEDIIPETIRTTEAEAIRALVEWGKGVRPDYNETNIFKNGLCLGKVDSWGTAFKACSPVTFVKGFRAEKEKEE